MAHPASAADEPITKIGTVEGITEYKLTNGLRVLLLPDASKPLVTVNLTVFVGSRHEGYGETGMAHLLEHMVFKGTPTFPDVPKALRDHGARVFNGTTWVDRTNYYETMPATEENLEFGIKLEADRMINSNIKKEELATEMTVVRNEFEAGENSPERILSQRMMATAFEWHNYGKSTIGNRADIEKVPVQNLKEFYKKFYQPDNAMLVVAGKFDEKKTLEFVVKYFGAIPKPKRVLPKTYTEEPAQDGERVVNLRRVGTVGATGVVYHIPAGAHPDYPAIEVLEDCLTASPAGRVYKSLVESKKASSISGSVFAWHDPGVLEITAKIEDPKGTEAARDALIETLENLEKTPITDEEVTRAKKRFEKFSENLLSNSDRFAVQLSEWAGAGDWRLYFLHRDRIEKVTAADVNRVAKEYLKRSNRTVGVFIPTQKAERASIPETPDVAKLLDGYKGRAAVAAGEAFEPTPENIEKRVTRGEFGALKTAYLPKKSRGEFVNVRLNLRFGNEESLKGNTSAVEFIGALMRRGAGDLNRQKIQDELDKLGAQVGISTQAGVLSVSINVKKENLPATLKLVETMLTKPTFPKEEFDLILRSSTERINSSKTEPAALAGNALARKLNPYPKDNIRYIPTLEENLERLKAVTLDQVKDIYTKQVGANDGELVAVGDFDVKVLEEGLAFLKTWKSKVEYKRITRETKEIEGGTEVINTPDKANAVYVAGIVFPMLDTDPDYAALKMGNYLFGEAALASRLSNRVRGEEGLSYGIGSMVAADSKDKRGGMQIFAITNPTNMKKVDALVTEEINKFLKDGLSAEELEAGKKALLEGYKVERASDAGIAGQLATGLYNGRTYKYTMDFEQKINDLTPRQIQDAYKKVLDPKKIVIIQAGDFQKK